MTATILYRIDSDKRMQRFYRLDVQQDFSGQWCLMREWGASAAPAASSVSFPTPHPAQAALDERRQAKERRDTSRSTIDDLRIVLLERRPP